MVVVVTRVYLVRHGRAAAGWDVDPDPPLDDLGRQQAMTVAAALSPKGPLDVVSSPLLRCQQTAFPLATAWGTTARIEPAVAEIPSPEGYEISERVAWLREAMAGTWSEVATRSGERYAAYRASTAAAIRALAGDTVIFSHFIAINAIIGEAMDDDRVVIARLDNCSVTTIDVDGNGCLQVVELGGEADTLIR